MYERLVAHSPDLKAWLDRYEILAGESLIERIAAGMDESDKFVIFLSPVSIKKPWVNRELRRAIMQEIKGVDPDFIIPVLIGEIAAVPPFLEDKKYIALFQLTEDEWLAELTSAIRGVRPSKGNEAAAKNITIHLEQEPDAPHVVYVVFQAQFWAERASFKVTTREDIVNAGFQLPAHKAPGLMMMNSVQKQKGRSFAMSTDQPDIRPAFPWVFRIEFAPGVDAGAAIKRAGQWDPWA